MRKRMVRRGGLVGLTAAAALLVAAVPASAAPGDGSAYAAQASVTLLGASTVNLGPLSPTTTSGTQDASLVGINSPGILTAGAVSSFSHFDAGSGEVHTGANLANVQLTVGALGSIGAVTVTCDATSAGNAGATNLLNVSLLGVTVPSNPAPNTVIAVPPGPVPPTIASITFNEQTTNPDGSLTVNGVHVHLALPVIATGDIVLGSATCGPAALPTPMASGVGLWIGLGLLTLIAVPVGVTVLRRRSADATA